MDLISAFNPVLVVIVEELTSLKGRKITEDIIWLCKDTLEKKYEVLFDHDNKTIYISGERR